MTRPLRTGAVEAPVLMLIGLLAVGSAQAAPAGLAWIVTPADAACFTEIELVGRSGAPVEVRLESDGQTVAMRFAKEGSPARAFLPIRVDQKPYANLMQRTDDAKGAVMVLSEQTQQAMRRGKMLQIAWLADEPLAGSLAGSEQGVTDLKTCGAQVYAQHRERLLDQAEQQARAASEARAKVLADEQLAAVRAQTAAADAERQRQAAEARAAQAQADRLAAETARQQALAESQRRQAMAAQYQYPAEQRWTPYRDQPAYREAPYREAPAYSDDDDEYVPPPRYGYGRYN